MSKLPNQENPGNRPAKAPANVKVALSDQVIFERASSAILDDFVHCSRDDFPEKMDRILSRLGSYAGVGRCYLYQLEPEATQAQISHAWRRPGEDSLPLLPETLSEADLARIKALFGPKQVIIANDIEGLDLRSGSFLNGLAATGVKAFASACITQNDQLLGFLCIDSPELQSWANLERNLLRLVADLYATVWSKLETEKALVAAMEAVRASNRAKSDFLANMSHEIRTPMNCVLGVTELLLDMDPTHNQRSYLQMIQHSGHSLLRLINEILDLSKIEAGHLELDPMETELRLMVEESVAMAAIQSQDKGLDMFCRYGSGIPLKLMVDRERLRKVLINLLSNATKFTNEGYIYLGIEKVAERGDFVDLKFEIRDTGIGIPEDKLETIFEKFTQADVSTTRSFGGTGLGLAISQKLINLMGSEISVTSIPGQGSTFSFTISIQQLSKAPPPAAHQDRSPVLLVTGSDLRAEIVTQMLQSLGHRCLVVHDWQEAKEQLAAAGEVRPQILVDEGVFVDTDPDIAADLDTWPDEEKPQAWLLVNLGNPPPEEDLLRWGYGGMLTTPLFCKALAMALAGRKPCLNDNQSLAQKTPGRGAGKPIPEPGQRGSVTIDDEQTRILLVDDHPLNQRVAQEMLKRLGCQVSTAGNGELALEKLEEQEFDLVFMDCQMPVMDGYEATRRIRRLQGEVAGIPIVALTANVMRRDLDACLAAGMDDTLTKPITQTKLHEMLEKWNLVCSLPGSS